jgi:AcrR family transcriptional regulator
LPRTEVKTERREQILEGLFEAMAREGTLGASVSDIAKAAGIARGALHYYFESKDEIRRCLMEHLGARYASDLDDYLDRTGARTDEPDALLRAVVRFHFGGEEDRSVRLMKVWIDFWGQAPSNPSMAAVVQQVQEGARERCRRALLAARPELTSLDDEALRHASAAVLALIEGGLLQWRVAIATDSPLDRDALTRRLTEAALAYASAMEVA